jgi:hypothetical protein
MFTFLTLPVSRARSARANAVNFSNDSVIESSVTKPAARPISSRKPKIQGYRLDDQQFRRVPRQRRWWRRTPLPTGAIYA